MADNQKFVQAQPFTLAGAGCSIGDTSVILNTMLDIDGNQLTMANFGTLGFGTIEPNNSSQEEQISFTGITVNANGTVTLTGVKNVAFLSPYTTTSGVLKTHPGGAKFIISNTSGFYDQMTSKDNDETINGIYTFTQSPVVPTPDGLTSSQVASVGYVDGIAISGSPKASSTVIGIAELSVDPVVASVPIALAYNDPAVSRIPSVATQAALVGNSSTVVAVSATNVFVTQQGFQRNQENYAVATGTSAALVVSLAPTPVALIAGQVVSFKSPVTTTGSPTLNVNSLGAKALVKPSSTGTTVLVAGDIATNVLVVAEYNGAQWQMLSTSSLGGVPGPIASNTLQVSNDGEVSTTSTSMTLVKTFLTILGGTYRMKFDTKYSGSNFGRFLLYVNGQDTGIVPSAQNINSLTYTTTTVDANLPGGLVQIYISAGSSSTSFVQNFRLYYDIGTIPSTVVPISI